MVAVRDDKLDPRLALKRAQQWTVVVLKALEHPSVNRKGCLRFRPRLQSALLLDLGNEPISRSGLRCRALPRGTIEFDLDELRKILKTIPPMIRAGARR